MPSRTVHNPVQGDTATFLETSVGTGGKLTLLEIDAKAGNGPPEHTHTAFDEEIVAIDGPLWVSVDGQARVLQQGERVTIPRGVRHTWKNAGEREVKFHARMVPGHQGFENFIRVSYGLARDGLVRKSGVPRDFATLALLLRWGDTNLPGVMRLLNPLFRFKARRAEDSGLGDRLRQQYDCE